jgi:MinD-like ATPase involved in chromosome partitioning or flagellar assembly
MNYLDNINREQAVKALLVVAFLVFLLKYRGSEEARVAIVFAFYFLAALIYRIDARYPVLAAIASLVLAAVLLAQRKEDLANRVAIYAYYFLVVGVLLNLVEYLRESREEEEYTPTRELKGKVLAVTSGKGGVGKTTLASNLAVALAKLNRRVLVVDLDLAMPNLDIAMGVNAKGLDKVLKEQRSVEEAVVRKHGCSILATLPIKNGYRSKETVEKIKKVIEEVKQSYEVVVLDFPPGIEALDVIGEDTYVLIIANPEKLSIADAYNVKRVLEGRAKLLGVVINKANGADVEAFEEMLSLPVLAILPEESMVKEALESETPLLTKDEEYEFSQEVKELVKFLLKYWEREEG